MSRSCESDEAGRSRKRKETVSSRQRFRRKAEEFDMLVRGKRLRGNSPSSSLEVCGNSSNEDVALDDEFESLLFPQFSNSERSENAMEVNSSDAPSGSASLLPNNSICPDVNCEDIVSYDETSMAGLTEELRKESTDEWFESCGSLNFDCAICINCECVLCDLCKHSPDSNCFHCDSCLSGIDEVDNDENYEEWFDCDSAEGKGDNILDTDAIKSPEESRNADMTNDLVNISLKHNLNHVVIEDFMGFLRKYQVGNFPKSARTLMKTPITVPLKEVAPGLYWHNGLLKHIQFYVDNYPECKEIKVKISYDGVPLATSSGSKFGPISCTINDSPEVYLIGVYHGEKKPNNVNDLFQDFVDEMVPLCNNGIQGKDSEVIKIRLECGICDAPAMAEVLLRPGHTAYFACPKCHVEGEYIDRRMSFADQDAMLRSDEDYHVVREGVQKSILGGIPYFGLVSGFPFDYMHLVLLGVMRKLMYMWISGPLNVRLSSRSVQNISNKLLLLVHWIPKEFVRKPRSLSYIKKFKATEFRQILLYTGPVVLCEVLPKVLYQNFLVLHMAIYILCDPVLSSTLVDDANALLKYFVETFIDFYGVQFVSYNVHGLIHLCNDVKKFGHLDKFSAFPFENFYQVLKKLIRKGDRPLAQLARRYSEIEKQKKGNIVRPNDQKMSFSGNHCRGPMLDNCSLPQYSVCSLDGISLDVRSEANNTCVLEDSSVVIAKNIAVCKDTGAKVIIGYTFMEVGDLYTVPYQSSALGIHLVSSLSSELAKWPVESIKKKCFRMPFQGGYAVIPLLHCERYES